MSYLKEHLKGPILKITDPREHSTEDILKSYFREILVIARKYTRPSVEFEDLVVEGLMGLLDAIKRWDPIKAGTNLRSFHNLAIVRIKSNMFDYFLANNTLYTVPNYMGRAMSLIEQIKNLVAGYEYPGNAQEVLLNYEHEGFEKHAPADYVRKVRTLKEKFLNLAKGFDKSYEEMIRGVLKIQENIESFEQGEEEFMSSPEEIAGKREYLDKILSVLKPNARDVIISLLEGETLEKAGEKQGFTRERARQIQKETLEFLQKTRMYRDALDE
jgi:RNA polymerase sigma factor for flagellar operon FliA